MESVYATDIDSDGDTDIVGSIRRFGGMTWWENTNGLGTAWGKHRIDASYHAEQRVDAIDMDGDGDVDIIGASKRINAVIWWENINSNGTEWAKHILSGNFSGVSWVYANDMDIDGDLDWVGVSLDLHEIAWFENEPAASDSK